MPKFIEITLDQSGERKCLINTDSIIRITRRHYDGATIVTDKNIIECVERYDDLKKMLDFTTVDVV